MAISVDFQSFVDEVVEKNDIVELISHYVTLKRVGNRFQALCPLHNDKKTPSFSVSPDKQLFHCFGCGAGGTVIHFIMAKENLDFMEAVKYLADRAGIPVPDFRSNAERTRAAEIHNKKKRLYEINSEAGKFFFKNLIAPEHDYALEYFRKRKLTNATIKSFGLGYAPNSWTSLIDYMREKGYSESELEDAGLAIKRDNGTYFDKFRDRVMFPIIDLRGNVIGFGGRILKDRDDAPKYLNTPETLIFKKKENLFAMNIAKNSKSGQFLLMEGYMDVISLHQNGFDNAVASLGTAFTPQQADILKKYADKAVLCYDSDEAGQKATERTGEILRDAGIKGRVLIMNDAKDPDEYINTKGADMFRLLTENAESFIEYKIHKIEKQYNLDDAAQKFEFIEQIAKVFANIKNDVEREIYIKKIARQTEVSPESISAQVDNLARKNRAFEKSRIEREEKRNYEARMGLKGDLSKMRLYNAEKLMLNLLCEKDIFLSFKDKLSPNDFSDDLHKRLAEIIFKTYENGEKIVPLSIISQFDESDIGRVSEILSDDKNVDNKKESATMPFKIISEYKLKREEKISTADGDTEKLQEIMNQLKRDKM